MEIIVSYSVYLHRVKNKYSDPTSVKFIINASSPIEAEKIAREALNNDTDYNDGPIDGDFEAVISPINLNKRGIVNINTDYSYWS